MSTESALDRALHKLGDARSTFIEMCARAVPRDRIAERWTLSWEQLDALKTHFRAEIAAWPNNPADEVARGRNVLPPGDRA